MIACELHASKLSKNSKLSSSLAHNNVHLSSTVIVLLYLLGVETGEEREKMDASRRALMSTLAMLE